MRFRDRVRCKKNPLEYCMTYMQKECPTHGMTKFKSEKQNKDGRIRWRCVACAYARQMKSFQKIKQEIIRLCGGKCRICGYDKCHEAMDFHHLDRTQKEFQLSCKLFGRDAKIKEAQKCILLCCRCHREVEAGVTALPEQMVCVV